ncbi:MAG: hypothetical protein AAF799_42245 [Myxococcota bacterium]
MSTAVSRSVGQGAIMVGLAALLGGCIKAAPGPIPEPGGDRGESPAPPLIVPRGYAVLGSGTPIFFDPRLGQPTARIRQLDARPDPWPSPGLAVRVVGEQDGTIAVSPILRDHDRHCESVLDGGVFDLVWFISPWSLVPVLNRNYEREFDDGTTISMLAGLPLRAADVPGRYAVANEDIRFEMELPEHVVGHNYESVVSMRGTVDSGLRFTPDMQMTFNGGTPIQVLAAPNLERGDVKIGWSSEDEGRHTVEFWSKCVGARVSSDRPPAHSRDTTGDATTGGDAPRRLSELASIGTRTERGSGAFGLSEPPEPPKPPRGRPPFHPVLEAGAPIYVPGIAEAVGVLRDARQFPESSFVSGERQCFTAELSRHFEPPLPLCFDVGEVYISTPESKPFDGGAVRVAPRSLEVPASLGEPEVAASLRRVRNEIRTCYGQALAAGVWSTAELTLELTVDGRGTVTAVEAAVDPRRLALECFEDAARGWTLPAPTDGRPAALTMKVELTIEPFRG